MPDQLIEWTDAAVEELKARWAARQGLTQIAREMGTSRNSIIGKSHRLNLHYAPGRGRSVAGASWVAKNAETVFPGRVKNPPRIGVLKPGNYQRKLGPIVQKGPWAGMRIYSLTLEERATCPTTCAQWLACYGNNMGHATRYRHGPELERAVYFDLVHLDRKHRGEFVVRLHILGDFYSLDYVTFWERCLADFPRMRVFGYTAWGTDTPIGAAIGHLRNDYWDRFAVRTSGAPEDSGYPRTIVVRNAGAAGDAIICPAQTGKTRSCSTCALCWSPSARRKTIAFLKH